LGEIDVFAATVIFLGFQGNVGGEGMGFAGNSFLKTRASREMLSPRFTQCRAAGNRYTIKKTKYSHFH
jgi:hypothetical protein